jgi:hypothetical protein
MIYNITIFYRIGHMTAQPTYSNPAQKSGYRVGHMTKQPRYSNSAQKCS